MKAFASVSGEGPGSCNRSLARSEAVSYTPTNIKEELCAPYVHLEALSRVLLQSLFHFEFVLVGRSNGLPANRQVRIELTLNVLNNMDKSSKAEVGKWCKGKAASWRKHGMRLQGKNPNTVKLTSPPPPYNPAEARPKVQSQSKEVLEGSGETP